MRKALYNLAGVMFTYKWWAISFWIIALGVAGFFGVSNYRAPSSEISIPGLQASKTLDRYNQLFPNSGQGSSRIVLAAPTGKSLNDYKTTVNQLVGNLNKVDGVTAAISPYIDPSALSSDKTIGYITVQTTNSIGTISKQTRSDVENLINQTRSKGLEVELGGDLVDKLPGEILGSSEIIGVAIALLVLVLTLGGLVAAGMPILVALFTVVGSMGALFAASKLLDINTTTPALAVMLGLAVGIDYSLFIINRYKALLLEGAGYKQAAQDALGTAGVAVVYAASTVIIALGALLVVNIPFMSTMGLAAAGTVLLAGLIALTLLPAFLGLVGKRIFGKKTRKLIGAAQERGHQHTEHVSHDPFWYKWGLGITKHPIVALVIAVVIAGVLAIPALDIKLGLPLDQYAAKSSSERKAYDLITKGFGPGYNGPLLVLLEGLPKVTPTQTNPYASYAEVNKIGQQIADISGVASVTPVAVINDGQIGVLQVIPDTAPGDTRTADLVKTLRDSSQQSQILKAAPGGSLAVTGTTAVQIDIDQRLSEALPIYLAVVVGLSFLILAFAFRSVIIPLKATLGFLLSVSAMFGAMVAVYQWGWFGLTDAPAPLTSFIPIISIGVLFGLAMDYEFFVVSSIRDAHMHTQDAKKAVRRGFAIGGKVVTAAGLIMVSVFAGFVGNNDQIIQSMGFGLAFGILVDAFLVRMTIIPALMSLFGNFVWWPFNK